MFHGNILHVLEDSLENTALHAKNWVRHSYFAIENMLPWQLETILGVLMNTFHVFSGSEIRNHFNVIVVINASPVPWQYHYLDTSPWQILQRDKNERASPEHRECEMKSSAG